MDSREVKVGIECRLGDKLQLLETGDIKTFVQDFCVNEIDPEGVVCQDTAPFYHPSYTPPLMAKDSPVLIPTREELASVLLIDDEQNVILDQIFQLYETTGSSEQVLCPVIADKEARTRAHLFFKKQFGAKLVTDTTSEGNLRISRRGLNSRQLSEDDSSFNRKRRYDPRNDKTEDTFPYVHAWLTKTGMDTMEAVHELSKQLRISPKDISFAGTKDRRAITTQRISFRNLAIGKLKGLHSEKYKLCNIRPANSQINLGELTGNRFSLIIRNIRPGPELSPERVQCLKEQLEKGFINYYGLQRFGTQSIGTHQVGIKMLKGDLLGAIDLLLSPNPACDTPDLLEAKNTWLEKHDEESAKRLLTKLPRQQNTERQLCMGLAKNSKDLQGAWMLVKREARMMYVHAVQSYIFNKTASNYISNNNHNIEQEELTLPVVGEDTDLNGFPYVRGVMEELGLKEIKSSCPGLWDLSGDERKVIVRPTDVEVKIIDASTLHLSFSLPRSAYATMTLRQLFLQINSK